jgi:hypothetical protein
MCRAMLTDATVALDALRALQRASMIAASYMAMRRQPAPVVIDAVRGAAATSVLRTSLVVLWQNQIRLLRSQQYANCMELHLQQAGCTNGMCSVAVINPHHFLRLSATVNNRNAL